MAITSANKKIPPSCRRAFASLSLGLLVLSYLVLASSWLEAATNDWPGIYEAHGEGAGGATVHEWMCVAQTDGTVNVIVRNTIFTNGMGSEDSLIAYKGKSSRITLKRSEHGGTNWLDYRIDSWQNDTKEFGFDLCNEVSFKRVKSSREAYTAFVRAERSIRKFETEFWPQFLTARTNSPVVAAKLLSPLFRLPTKDQDGKKKAIRSLQDTDLLRELRSSTFRPLGNDPRKFELISDDLISKKHFIVEECEGNFKVTKYYYIPVSGPG